MYFFVFSSFHYFIHLARTENKHLSLAAQHNEKSFSECGSPSGNHPDPGDKEQTSAGLRGAFPMHPQLSASVTRSPPCR